jgi:hypothetical protein
MWPFKRKPIKVTPDEMAAALWEWIRKNIRNCYTKLEAQADFGTAQLEPDEQLTLAREITIAHLWATSNILNSLNVLGSHKEVLDALHHRYLVGHYDLGETAEEKGNIANAAQSELLERYDKYYKALGPERKGDGWQALSFEMAQFFFPRRKPVLNAFLSFAIHTHIATFAVGTLKFREGFEIVAS